MVFSDVKCVLITGLGLLGDSSIPVIRFGI